MNLAIGIQHHPARAHLIPQLVSQLGDCEVITDPDPDATVRSPLRTYLLALQRCPPDCDWWLIVQDDVTACSDFRTRALARLHERPQADAIAFFVPGASPHKRAIMQAKHGWAQLAPTWIPTVALAWRPEHAAAFLADHAEIDPYRRRGDDGPVGKWLARKRLRVLAPVPSLIEHPDAEPSLIGRRARGGANKARVAASFEG